MADIRLERLVENMVLGSDNLPIENGTNLVPISEATLKSIFDRHRESGYIVLSANRTEDKNRTREDNVAAYRGLLSALKNSPFGYLPVWGGFREEGRDTANPEPSFLVFPQKTRKEHGGEASFDALLDFGLELGRKYAQDSIVVRYPMDYEGEMAGRTTWVDCRTGRDTTEFGEDPVWDDPEQEFYTKDRRGGKGGSSAFRRWMAGGDPTTSSELGRTPKRGKTPKAPQRFTSPYLGDISESYQFFVESPSQTLNRAMDRKYSGYDTEICEVLPWYRGRTGSV